MTTFELLPEADMDLAGGAAFYEEGVPGLGLDFIDEVQRAIEAICDRPLAHPLWPDVPQGMAVRRKLLRRFPYGLPFLLVDQVVIVLAVAHLSRSPAFWMRRVADESK